MTFILAFLLLKVNLITLLRGLLDINFLLIYQKTNAIVFNKHMYNATPIDYCTYLPDIRIVDSLKILGVILSYNLSWSQHFNSVISRVAKRLYLLRVLRSLISHSDLHKMFNSSICSAIEYAAPLFCVPSSVICNTLDSFYKRCTKITQCKRVSCNISHVSTCTRFTNLSIKLLLTAEKGKSHKLNHCISHRLTHTNVFNIQFCATTRRKKCFVIAAPLLSNTYPTNSTEQF